MPTPTQENTQRISELSERVVDLAGKFERFAEVNMLTLESLQRELAEVTAERNRLADEIKACVVLLGRYEERIKALEKSTDRTWQFAPIILSAIAILVSLLVAVVKK